MPPDSIYPYAGQPNSRERQVLVVSKNNVTFKESGNEALVWVTDLQSGRPLANAPVTFMQGQTKLTQTKTNSDGVAQIDYERFRALEGVHFALLGNKLPFKLPLDNDFGLGVNQWNKGITRYYFGRVDNPEDAQAAYKGYFYTHRPIYRPNEIVYFKGIIRANDDAHYRVPTEAEKVEVVIHDGQGKEVYKREVPLNEKMISPTRPSLVALGHIGKKLK